MNSHWERVEIYTLISCLETHPRAQHRFLWIEGEIFSIEKRITGRHVESGSKWLKQKVVHQIRASQVRTNQVGIEEVSASQESAAQRCALQIGAQVFLCVGPVGMLDKSGCRCAGGRTGWRARPVLRCRRD